MQARPYQTLAIDTIWRALCSKSTALCVAPCGAGKTFIFQELCKRAVKVKPNVKILIVVNKVDLADQTARRFSGLASTYCASLNQRNLSNITVATIQSVYKADLGSFQWLLCDEVHRFNQNDDSLYQKLYKKLLQQNERLKVLGFTATPYSSSGYIFGPGHLFDKVDYTISLEELWEQGHLVRPRCKAGREQFETKDLKIVAGDFFQGEVSELVRDSRKVEDQLKDALPRLTSRRKVAWACANIEHAVAVHSKLTLASIVHSKQTPEVRKQNQDEFEKGGNRHIVFVNVLSEGYDCLDSQTEVLTEKGWRGIDGIAEGDNVYSLNRINRKIEITPCYRPFSRPVKTTEKFVTIKSQHLDIRVTDKHRFAFTKTTGVPRRIDNGLLLENYTGLNKRPVLFQGGVSSFNERGLGLTPEKAWLLGMLWTDGYVTKDGSKTSIYQSKPAIIEKIRAALRVSKLDFTERLKKPSKAAFKYNNQLIEFSIPKGTHGGRYARSGWLKQIGPFFNKKEDPTLMGMSKEEFKSFWSGMIDGDGSVSKNKNKAPLVTICEKPRVDFLMHLAIKLGLTAMYGERKSKYGTTIYTLRIREKITHGLNLKDSRGAKLKIEAPKTGERVWCLSNKNETLITRRNGKIVVMGNCPQIDAIVLMRPTRSPVTYVQTVGRALRLSPGKDDALILDYGQVIENCGPITDPNVRKAGSKKAVKTEMKFCPNCMEYVPVSAEKCPACDYEFPMKKRETHLTKTAFSGSITARNISTYKIKYVSMTPYVSKNNNACLRVNYFTTDMLHSMVPEFFVWGNPYAEKRAVKRLVEFGCSMFTDLNKTAAQQVQRVPQFIEVVHEKYARVERVIYPTQHIGLS